MSRAKGNRLERAVMPLLIAADAPCPVLGAAASSTGRLGHLTELGIDGATKRLAVECKSRESIGDWVFDLAEQTSSRAATYNKLGAVVLKKNRRNPAVLMTLHDYLLLLNGDPP